MFPRQNPIAEGSSMRHAALAWLSCFLDKQGGSADWTGEIVCAALLQPVTQAAQMVDVATGQHLCSLYTIMQSANSILACQVLLNNDGQRKQILIWSNHTPQQEAGGPNSTCNMMTACNTLRKLAAFTADTHLTLMNAVCCASRQQSIVGTA